MSARFSTDFHGVMVDFHADAEGVEITSARVLDHAELVRWAVESASDEMLSKIAGVIVREQRARDEAAGPFIILASNGCSEKGEVRIDMDELEAVVVAARGLISGFPNIGVRVAGHGVPSRAGSASDLQK